MVNFDELEPSHWGKISLVREFDSIKTRLKKSELSSPIKFKDPSEWKSTGSRPCERISLERLSEYRKILTNYTVLVLITPYLF